MSSEYYNSFMSQVDQIIRSKNYRIEVEDSNHQIIDANDIDYSYHYIFYIYNDSQIITSLEIYVVKEDIVFHNTRSHKGETHVVCNIKHVITSLAYRKQNLATLLIIYGISYLKIKHENMVAAILDDVSDFSKKTDIGPYTRLGFVPRDNTSLSMKKRKELNLLDGPEKQVILDTHFINRIFRLLQRIEANNASNSDAGIPKKTKNKQTKKQKKTKNKQKTNKKTKKNKKQKTNKKKQKTKNKTNL